MFIVTSNLKTFSGLRVRAAPSPVVHTTLQDAQAEASRLARIEPNRVFYIMEGIREVSLDDTPVTIRNI